MRVPRHQGQAPQPDNGPGFPWRLVFALIVTGVIAWLVVDNWSLLGDSQQPRLVYLVAFLLLALFGFGWLRGINLSQGLKYAAIWIGVALVIALGYAFREELGFVSDRLSSELLPEYGVETADGLVLRASEDGHFYVRASVNGAPVRFMIDTGASHILLDKDDARRAGYAPENLTYDRIYETANGLSQGASVQLDELRIKDMVLRRVDASVAGGEVGVSLLGMSFLRRFSGFEVRGDELILKP